MTTTTLQRFDRLDEALDQLLVELAAHSDSVLNTPPQPGAWSAVQTVHHLLLSESLSLAYLRKKLSFNPVLPAAGLAEKAREWFLVLFYKTSIKRTAPTMIAGSNLPERASLAETQAEWRQTRKDLRSYLAKLPPTLFEKSAFKHPFVGRMSIAGMLHFHLLHFQHHRKQILAAVQAAKINGQG
jgi:uncharacterized damage-inducible protein DinB